MESKIKNILIKLNDWKFIILLVLVIVGAFYWYEYRPAHVYKECTKKEINLFQDKSYLDEKALNFFYSICVKGRGIKN